MSDINEQAEIFVKIFRESGLVIELGAQYSVKGQIAQLINGSKKLIEEMQSEIDTLKSSEPFGWWIDVKEKWTCSLFIKNKRSEMAGPPDEFEEKYKDQLTPLFKCSQPKSPTLLTDAEINKSFPDGFRTDEYESGFYDGARWAESKVRVQ